MEKRSSWVHPQGHPADFFVNLIAGPEADQPEDHGGLNCDVPLLLLLLLPLLLLLLLPLLLLLLLLLLQPRFLPFHVH